MQELGIGLDGRAWKIFGSNQHWCHGLGGKQLSNALVACEGYLDVGGIGQPVGIDDWLVGHVCRGDGDIAARKWCYKSDDARGVIIAVVGGTGDEIVLVSEVTSNVQVFDLRPIRGETS